MRYSCGSSQKHNTAPNPLQSFYATYFATHILRADVSKYQPEVYRSEKSKILKKIHKVALGKLLT